MRKQNRHKNERRRRLRYKENEEAIKRKILQIQGDTELTLDKDFVIDHDIPEAIATLKVHEMCYLSSILNNTSTTTQAVQTIRASLSKSCFRKLVGIAAIDACHAKQTPGDKHATIQNKAAESLEHEENVQGEEDRDETEEVDKEEEDDDSSSFVEDSD